MTPSDHSYTDAPVYSPPMAELEHGHARRHPSGSDVYQPTETSS